MADCQAPGLTWTAFPRTGWSPAAFCGSCVAAAAGYLGGRLPSPGVSGAGVSSED